MSKRLIFLGISFCSVFVMHAMEEGMQPIKKTKVEISSQEQSKLLKELVTKILTVPSLREYAILKIADFVADNKIAPQQLIHLPENLGPVILELSKIRTAVSGSVKRTDESLFLERLGNFIQTKVAHIHTSQEEFDETRSFFSKLKQYIPTSLSNAFQLFLGKAWIDRNFVILLTDFAEDQMSENDLQKVKKAIQEYRTMTEKVMSMTQSGTIPFDEFILQEPTSNLLGLFNSYQKKYESDLQILSNLSVIKNWFEAVVYLNDPLLVDSIILQCKPETLQNLISLNLIYDVIYALYADFLRLSNNNAFYQLSEQNKFFILDFINAYDLALRFSPHKERMQEYTINDKSVTQIFNDLPKIGSIIKNYKQGGLSDGDFMENLENTIEEIELFGREAESEEE